MRIGKNMKDALRFALKYPNWHSFSNERATKDAIKRLEALGLVRTNPFQQFRRVLTTAQAEA